MSELGKSGFIFRRPRRQRTEIELPSLEELLEPPKGVRRRKQPLRTQARVKVKAAVIKPRRRRRKKRAPVELPPEEVERRWARMGRTRKRKPGEAVTSDRMILTMQPGEWHAVLDIVAASGCNRVSIYAATYRLKRWGWIERVENPDYDRTGGYGQDAPRYFIRLTEKGLKARALAEVIWG